MKVQLEEVKEKGTKKKNTRKRKSFTEEEIEKYCKSVEELLDDIHGRCGDLN